MDISVVMTTLNGEKYLEKQIQSILDQTLKPSEFIVCDDGSTDGTIAILEKYRLQQQLKYYINPYTLGLINNFKKVVSLASNTNYIALSDQDDQWLPDKLEKSATLLKKIEDTQVPCMVYTDLLFIDEADKVLNTSFRNELGQDKYHHNLQTLLFTNFVNGCTVLMNPIMKCLFADMPEKVSLNHDGWLALTAFTLGKAEGINEALVRYRKHSNNVSIATDAKLRNRYQSTLKQLIAAIKGKDQFLSTQFEAVRKFYNQYALIMTLEKKQNFETFLQLEDQNYFIKKLAFRRIVKKFQL